MNILFNGLWVIFPVVYGIGFYFATKRGIVSMCKKDLKMHGVLAFSGGFLGANLSWKLANSIYYN
jgi:hypothetical protein